MRLHHLAFRTADVDGLVRFLRELFELEEVRDQRPRSVWLALGDCAVLMVEAREPDEPIVPPGTRELVAFDADEALRARVRERAIASGCFDGETQHTVYVRDPDGRRLAVSTHPLVRPSGPSARSPS